MTTNPTSGQFGGGPFSGQPFGVDAPGIAGGGTGGTGGGSTNSVLSAAIKQAYASAPANVVVLHTLEFLHPSFATPLRVVRDYAALTATLEATAPANAGQQVAFTPYAFDFKLPPVGDQGLPEIEVTIDNVGADLIGYFDQAANSSAPVTMIYRPYLSTDTTAPHMNPPLVLTLKKISVDLVKVTATASFTDLGNLRFPGVMYTAATFPGLAA